MSPLPRTAPAPGANDPGGGTRRILVLVAWITVGMALVSRLLDVPMGAPIRGGLLVLAALTPLLLLSAVLVLTIRGRIQARRSPERFRSSGWGVVAWSLGAAVAGVLVTFPLLTSSRAPVRPRAAQDHIQVAVEALLGAWDDAVQQGVPSADLPARLTEALAVERPRWKNPYRTDAPAFAPSLQRFGGLPDEAAVTKALEPLATEPGVVVAACQLPGNGVPAFRGGGGPMPR